MFLMCFLSSTHAMYRFIQSKDLAQDFLALCKADSSFFFFFFSHNASKVNLLELLPLCLLVCLNLPDVGGNGGKGRKGFHFVCTFITIISNGHSNNSQWIRIAELNKTILLQFSNISFQALPLFFYTYMMSILCSDSLSLLYSISWLFSVVTAGTF